VACASIEHISMRRCASAVLNRANFRHWQNSSSMRLPLCRSFRRCRWTRVPDARAKGVAARAATKAMPARARLARAGVLCCTLGFRTVNLCVASCTRDYVHRLLGISRDSGGSEDSEKSTLPADGGADRLERSGFNAAALSYAPAAESTVCYRDQPKRLGQEFTRYALLVAVRVRPPQRPVSMRCSRRASHTAEIRSQRSAVVDY